MPRLSLIKRHSLLVETWMKNLILSIEMGAFKGYVLVVLKVSKFILSGAQGV